jgi:hypothetical protein
MGVSATVRGFSDGVIVIVIVVTRVQPIAIPVSKGVIRGIGYFPSPHHAAMIFKQATVCDKCQSCQVRCDQPTQCRDGFSHSCVVFMHPFQVVRSSAFRCLSIVRAVFSYPPTMLTAHVTPSCAAFCAYTLLSHTIALITHGVCGFGIAENGMPTTLTHMVPCSLFMGFMDGWMDGWMHGLHARIMIHGIADHIVHGW